MLYMNLQPLENKQNEQSDSKTASMTDDNIDWPLPNKTLGCATVWKTWKFAELRSRRRGVKVDDHGVSLITKPRAKIRTAGNHGCWQN